jgi:predicted DNA binding CopG/RHH family protein
MKPVSFECQPKDKSIAMRLPETLFETIKEETECSSGVPYQLFIR